MCSSSVVLLLAACATEHLSDPGQLEVHTGGHVTTCCFVEVCLGTLDVAHSGTVLEVAHVLPEFEMYALTMTLNTHDGSRLAYPHLRYLELLVETSDEENDNCASSRLVRYADIVWIPTRSHELSYIIPTGKSVFYRHEKLRITVLKPAFKVNKCRFRVIGYAHHNTWGAQREMF